MMSRCTLNINCFTLTLKTRVRIILGTTFLLLEILQYLIVVHFLTESPAGYILLFVFGTSIATIIIIILYLESNILRKFYYVDRSIATIAKLYKSSTPLLKTKDETVQFLDYIYGLIEELQQSKHALQSSKSILALAQKSTCIGSWDLDLATGKVRC